MAYIFRQKLNLADLAELGRPAKRILIYEPEADLSALYAHYLREHNFDIKHCLNLDAIVNSVSHFRPHLLIFNAEAPDVLARLKLLPVSLGPENQGLSLISTGYNLNAQKISELMAAGVASHINRRLSRPEDLAVVVRAILQ